MKMVFYSFAMGDVDDIDIYVAQPISQWQETEQGRWVMEHARDLAYYTDADPNTLSYRVSIRGIIDEGPALTEYLLRWGK